MNNSRILVAIGTRNRPNRLARTLDALSTQTCPPALVAICDSSDRELRTAGEMAAKASSLRILYLTSERQSVNIQRNLAIQTAQALEDFDFVQILDDDTEPVPDFLLKLSGWLEAHPQCIGVSGVTAPAVPTWNYRNRISRQCSLIAGLDSVRQGAVTAAGVNTPVFASQVDPVRVEWLMGCSMWRNSIFHQLQFNTDFQGSSLGDDVEFSVRAALVGELWVLPDAVLQHNQDSEGRPDSYLHSYRFTRNRWEIVKTMGPQGSRLRFWTSVGWGILQKTKQTVSTVVKGRDAKNDFLSLLGMIAGANAVIFGKQIK